MQRACAALVAAVVLGGCAEGTTQPDVVFQVIEELDFAPSLGVDLAAMTRTESGSYLQDVVEGTGPQVVYGSVLTINLTGWLPNGTEWINSTESLLLGNTSVILGLEDAVFLMREGGERLAVIPPERAFGGLPHYDSFGGILVPAGSVIVLRVEAVSVVNEEGA